MYAQLMGKAVEAFLPTIARDSSCGREFHADGGQRLVSCGTGEVTRIEIDKAGTGAFARVSPAEGWEWV